MQSKNIRYSITLNEAQLDYLSDEQQDILRMKSLKTFIRMAVREETTVSGKNYSAVLQPGQFVASKVDLARMWECDRKTATRIVHEFNQLGILRSKASNRTTIHTLICLSAWFSSQGMKRSRFFDSNPVVKPIEKPARKAKRVPPETAVDTPKFDGAIPADPGGAQWTHPHIFSFSLCFQTDGKGDAGGGDPPATGPETWAHPSRHPGFLPSFSPGPI